MKSTSNAVSTTVLCIADVVIRQDEEGRYCLNDLHKAAGGESRHRPSRWLETLQAQELIVEIEEETAGIPAVSGRIPAVKTVEGRMGGTFAWPEVAIAFSAWISATFHLKVIRTFMAVQAGKMLHNHYSELTIQDWARLINTRIRLMKDLSRCDDVGVAGGIYANILHVSMRLGIATDPMSKLCPGVRQMTFDDLEGGAA